MSKLDGKVAIITGCAGGIGKQMAIKFAKKGAKLAICDIMLEKLQETAKICEENGAEVLCLKTNVTKYEELENLVNKTAERFGTIDILVNNAHGGHLPDGQKEDMSFMDTPVSYYQHYIEGNLYSTINMMQLCIPFMKGKTDASIINFSSCASKGMNGLGYMMSAFGTAKGAVAEMSRLAAYDLGQYGIRVNVVFPGVVTDTIIATSSENALSMDQLLPMMANNPMKRAGNPYDDVAPVAVFLASEDSKFMTGQSFYVNGGNWMAV